MDILDAIRQRHSVRTYKTDPIEDTKVTMLRSAISDCNRQSGLSIRLITNEPRAFSSRMARYGKFDAVRNYFAMIGPARDPLLDEKLGFWGEKMVLMAQLIGLNTCWAGLTYRKVPDALKLQQGEKLRALIAVGYGTTQGVQHKSKSPDKVASSLMEGGKWPEWFVCGVQAALLAPSAINQMKFRFVLQPDGRTVRATAGLGFFSHIDLGIAKYHFEQGAAKKDILWA